MLRDFYRPCLSPGYLITLVERLVRCLPCLLLIGTIALLTACEGNNQPPTEEPVAPPSGQEAVTSTPTPAPPPTPPPEPPTPSPAVPLEAGSPVWSPPTAALTNPLSKLLELPPNADVLAFSPDSALLALGTSDFRFQVWEIAGPTLRWETPFTDYLRKIQFSPDGTRVAAVSFDGSARLWAVESGDEITRQMYDYWVYGLDFSADSQWVATGSFDSKAIVWNSNDGSVVGEFDNAHPIHDLALSPNGPWLALMTAESWGPVELIVWDILTREQRSLALAEIPPSHSNVVFSPDTAWLAASVSPQDGIQIWQTQTWPEVTRLAIPTGSVSQIAFSANGTRLAAVISSGVGATTVWVWDVPSWQPIAQIDQPDTVFDMALSPDGRRLVTGLGQGEGSTHPAVYGALLWEIADGALAGSMPHSSQVLSVAFSPDGRFIASGGGNTPAAVWHVPD